MLTQTSLDIVNCGIRPTFTGTRDHKSIIVRLDRTLVSMWYNGSKVRRTTLLGIIVGLQRSPGRGSG